VRGNVHVPRSRLVLAEENNKQRPAVNLYIALVHWVSAATLLRCC
jgi:hypothetical protein